MKPGDKVRVSVNAPFHSGRIGYFVHDCQGVARNIAVLTTEKEIDSLCVGLTYFAVDQKWIEEV